MATRDRNQTEQRILDAVGRIVEAEGFEAVGVNAVASVSGVSKVLIYRYFALKISKTSVELRFFFLFLLRKIK